MVPAPSPTTTQPEALRATAKPAPSPTTTQPEALRAAGNLRGVAGDVSGDLTGRKLGNYRIEGVLGTGGMSVMYKATDVRLGRKVALKVIGEHLGADAEFRERFVDEARNTSAIDHANIVPVYDFGELDGMLYIAMRLVDGSDLASRIGHGKMAPERALALLEQVADALDALHERGLVHLDMKPANVLVTGRESAREHVYIADFGLTRRGTTGPRTRGDDFLGSPTYAAPEHLRGEPLDGRTDQYALACVAYACLTGHPPYQGEVSAVIKGHLGGQPPPISRVTGLPPAVDAVIQKGMAKTPDERYGGCGELVSAVREAIRTSPAASAGGTSGAAAAAAAPAPQATSTVRNMAPAHPGHARAPAPQTPPPQTPPPGLGGPPMGAPGPAPHPQAGRAPGPGTPQAPPPPPAPPPGYGPAYGTPGFAQSGGDGGGGGNKMPWIVGAVAIALVIVGTVLVIVFAGGDGEGSNAPNTVPEPTGRSAPDIPMGPGSSQDRQPSDGSSARTPPPSIPVEPG